MKKVFCFIIISFSLFVLCSCKTNPFSLENTSFDFLYHTYVLDNSPNLTISSLTIDGDLKLSSDTQDIPASQTLDQIVFEEDEFLSNNRLDNANINNEVIKFVTNDIVSAYKTIFNKSGQYVTLYLLLQRDLTLNVLWFNGDNLSYIMCFDKAQEKNLRVGCYMNSVMNKYNDFARITLGEDNSFSFFFTIFSTYQGVGTYTTNNGYLYCSFNDNEIAVFKIDHNKITVKVFTEGKHMSNIQLGQKFEYYDGTFY